MATPLIFDLDALTIPSAASGVAPSDLIAAIATVQAATVASHQRVAAIEVVS
jgi:hypothetical protein